jgi:competence protein ComEA
MSPPSLWWPPLLAATALLLSYPGPSKAAQAKQLVGKANLNTATAEQLTLLPGIGPVTAERIVERRKEKPFERTWEITQVRGIGAKLFRKVENHLTVDGPSDLRRLDPPRPPRKTKPKRGKKRPPSTESRGPKIIDFRNPRTRAPTAGRTQGGLLDGMGGGE